jgi:hypothetical protein
MGQEHNENLFPIHIPSILDGAQVAISWVWPSCTKCRLRAIWAWKILISIKYHQLWARKRPCELIKVGTSKGQRPQPVLPISQLQDCTESLPFTHGLWTSSTHFSFARLYYKSSFHLWTMDLFLPVFHLQDCTKAFLSPMCCIISSSIIYGTTWTAKNSAPKEHHFAMPLRM